MKTLILLAGAIFLTTPLHAQVVAPASFTLKLSSCMPAPPAPTAQFPQPDGSIVWGYLRIGDVWPCTITVPVAGTYTVSGLAGSAWSGTSFHFESPKGTSIGTLTAANTGSWSTYQPISTTLTLPAGQIPLLLILDVSAANLNDALTFAYVAPPPPPQPDSITVQGQLLWCAKCDGTDNTPATGNLVVAQTGAGSTTQNIMPDGSVSVQSTVDVSQDPLEFVIELTDGAGNVQPGASLTLTFPKFELNSPGFLVGTITIGIVRIAHVTDAEGNPAIRIVDVSAFSIGK